jgi:hypothetical protein
METLDTFGIPEFFITDTVTEIDGANVRIICGVRRGGRVHWLYSAVMAAEPMFRAALQCREAAERAFNVQEMIGGKAAH